MKTALLCCYKTKIYVKLVFRLFLMELPSVLIRNNYDKKTHGLSLNRHTHTHYYAKIDSGVCIAHPQFAAHVDPES